MLALESALETVSLFEHFRPDEIARIARRFTIVSLTAGRTHSLGTAPEELRMAIVLSGRVRLAVDVPGGTLRSRMEPGDRCGDLSLLTAHGRATRLEATTDASLALLDRAGLDAVVDEFPAVALPLCDELSRELSARNDVARQLTELHAEGLPPAELADAVDERRRTLLDRGARVSRLSPRALFRRLVVARGAEPPFWMLLGFATSLGIARLVVGTILKFGLEHRLFALVPGHDPHPMHVHHFNYGLVLIGLSGLSALFPFGRKALRVLAFAFGFGCGLVFDEFALFWNLNPEYAQRMSLVAAALMAAALAQAVYFRSFWVALARRTILSARGAR